VSVLAPDARERRTIVIGGATLVVALLISTFLLPAASRWRDREAMIDALRRQRAQLVSLGTHREALEAVVQARAAALEALPVRLVHGRTPALAASALQALLQEYASAARVSVTRLDVASGGVETTDVASGGEATAGVPAIPATISAVSDIYGLADFLARVEHGGHWLEVAELAVSPNSALRGELLQMSLVVRAPYLLDP
jgi:hypothetical protein